MKNSFIAFLFGLIIGAGAFWYFTEGQKKESVQRAQENVAAGAERRGHQSQAGARSESLGIDHLGGHHRRSRDVVGHRFGLRAYWQSDAPRDGNRRRARSNLHLAAQAIQVMRNPNSGLEAIPESTHVIG